MNDLHTFLANHERQHPDEVLHIHEEVDAAYVPTIIATKLEQEEKYPVLVFHAVRTAAGQRSPFPLVTNLLASRRLCAEAMQSSVRQVGIDYCQRLQRGGRKPVVVDPREAPVKEVRRLGEEADLRVLPATVHHEGDPGPYLTAGYFTCYDPASGVDNSSLHRGWIKGPREIRVWMSQHQHARINLEEHERLGRDMKVAFWVGHHPAVLLGAQAELEYPGSHFEAAGAVFGEPLRLVPSETLGDDFLVPADAEFVIEGVMRAGRRAAEGPFGEFTGYTGPQVASPVMEVTAITHRSDAWWHDIQVGHADNRVMGGFALEGSAYEMLAARIPSVRNVYFPLSGACRMHAYVQLENPRPGEAREAILATILTQNTVKHIFVFDADVDIFDEREALWAIATRTQWDRDVIIIPRLRGVDLDPSIESSTSTRAGIDCTIPAGEPYSERNRLPASVWEATDLARLLGREQLQRLQTERM